MSYKPAIDVEAIENRASTTYPEAFRAPVVDRFRRVLGNHFGLSQFGVNYVELAPGAWSAQRHWHTAEDELVYIVQGELTLVTDGGKQRLTAGMVAGFPAGVENGHHLINESSATAAYLEVGTRNPAADEVFYPDIDLELRSDGSGGRDFRRRDGGSYDAAGD